MQNSQNARKHGFTSAAYTVVRLEDIEEVANLKHDAVEFYQPITSQEHYAVERIAITQQAMLRAARLEAGLFTSCLNDVLDMRERPLMMMDPDMSADTEVGHEQTRNFLLAEGFKRLLAKSPAMSLCLRYSAQAERLHRRALDEFNRLKALRPEPSGADLPLCALPTPVAESNPHPPARPPENIPDPQPAQGATISPNGVTRPGEPAGEAEERPTCSPRCPERRHRASRRHIPCAGEVVRPEIRRASGGFRGSSVLPDRGIARFPRNRGKQGSRNPCSYRGPGPHLVRTVPGSRPSGAPLFPL